jgi:hypothetical protein
MAEQPNIVKTTLIPTQEEKDDYAIEFAEWIFEKPKFKVKHNSKRELLEIFKKERNL